MKVLLVAATRFEIEPLLNELESEALLTNKLKSYKLNSTLVDVLITGVGMTATAFELGKVLAKNQYDLVLNFGVAGAFSDQLKLGVVVNVTADRIVELGVEDGKRFTPFHELNITDEYLSSHGIFHNSSQLTSSTISVLPEVSGITVNTVHGEEDSITKVKNQFNPDVESMEGAAVFYACLSEEVPCLQLRTISNKVEPRNKDNWEMELAINNLCKTGLQLIKEL